MMTSHTRLRCSVAVIAMIAATTPAIAQSTIFRSDGRAELRRVQGNVALRYADALTIAHRILAEDLRVTRTPRLSDDLGNTDRPPADYDQIDQRLVTEYGLRARFCDGGLLTYLDPDAFSAGVTPEQIRVAVALSRRAGAINDVTTTNIIGFVENGDYISRFNARTPLTDCLNDDYASAVPNQRPAIFTPIEQLSNDAYGFAVDTFRHAACTNGKVGGGVLFANTNTFARTRAGGIRRTSLNLNETVVQDLCRDPISGTREVVRLCTLTVAGLDHRSTFTVSTPYLEISDPNDPFATIIDFTNTGSIIRSRCTAIPEDAPTINTTGIDQTITSSLACPIDFPEGERFGEHSVTTTTTSFTTGQPDIVNVFTTDVTESVNDCYRLESRVREASASVACEAPFSGGLFDATTSTEETFRVFADGRDEVLDPNSTVVTSEVITNNACFNDIITFEDDPVTYSCGHFQSGGITTTYQQRVTTRVFADPTFADQELSRVDHSVTVTSNTCRCVGREAAEAGCIATGSNGYTTGTVVDFGGHAPDSDGLGIEGNASNGASNGSTGNGGDGGGDGACVIYSELASQSRLSRGDQMINWYWTRTRYADPEHMIRGYQFWAKPVVARMQTSPRLSAVADCLAQARLREIEYQLGRRERSSLAGKMVRLVTEPLSWALGFFVPPLLGEGHKAPHGPTKEIINA